MLLTGCASATPPRDQTSPPTPTTAAAAASSSSQVVGPSESAQMICSLEVGTQVAAILHLPNPPPTTSSWADHVYTCIYHLAAGPLTLSVQESADPASARSYFTHVQAAPRRRSTTLGPRRIRLRRTSRVRCRYSRTTRPCASTSPNYPANSASHHPYCAPTWPRNSPPRSWAAGPAHSPQQQSRWSRGQHNGAAPNLLLRTAPRPTRSGLLGRIAARAPGTCTTVPPTVSVPLEQRHA